MTNPLAKAAVETGLIPQDALEEFRRWRPPFEIPDTVPEPPKDVTEAATRIREALEGEGLVLTRETDLQILRQYLSTQTNGTLHLVVNSDDGPSEADFPVVFGQSPLGKFIFPWQGDNLKDEMTNGMTHLVLSDGRRVFFQDLDEVYYDEFKAFMVCEVSTIEDPPALPEKTDG